MITLALADDEALFRKGMRSLIEDFGTIQVVLEAENGQDLLDQLATTSPLPDVLLLDLNMPVLNGIEAAKIIRQTYPDLKVIVLSTYYDKAFISNMIEIGASAYLAKNTQPEIVERTIREVVDKGFYYSQEVLEVIRANMLNKGKSKKQLPFDVRLSSRELEILELICNQYTTPEISKQLFISTRTVEGHRNNLMSKLNCRNAAGLVVFALQHDLVTPSLQRF
jgi:DNA-binding NarL/FixJ family response regulator